MDKTPAAGASNGWMSRRERARGFLKGASGLIGTVATLVGMLLALGLIRPFGQSAEEAVASAADKTQAGTSKLVLDASITKSSTQTDEVASSFTAEGGFDYRTKRGRLTYDYSQTPGLEDVTSVPTIFNRRIVYMKFPPSRGIPRRRPWIRMNLANVDQLLNGQEGSLSSVSGVDVNDPSKALDYLKKSADVEEIGDETVFGKKTTRYRGTIPADELGNGEAHGAMRRVSTNAWIDESGILRQLTLSGSDGAQRFDLKFQLYKFGGAVRADPPPASRVTDVGDLPNIGQ